MLIFFGLFCFTSLFSSCFFVSRCLYSSPYFSLYQAFFRYSVLFFPFLITSVSSLHAARPSLNCYCALPCICNFLAHDSTLVSNQQVVWHTAGKLQFLQLYDLQCGPAPLFMSRIPGYVSILGGYDGVDIAIRKMRSVAHELLTWVVLIYPVWFITICLPTLSVSQTVQRQEVECLVGNELETTWKRPWPTLRYPQGTFWRAWRTTTECLSQNIRAVKWDLLSPSLSVNSTRICCLRWEKP